MSNNKQKRQGIDVLLQRKGKSLQTGQKISFTLVKGPSINRDAIPDPVNPLAPKECFPLIAKFPESVVKPDFSKSPWHNARLYQQDVPKAHIDSDEEAEEQAAIEAKKKWRRKRNDPPKRQWVLQEQVEFLETMMAKRQKKEGFVPGNVSSRYEGVPEHNSSHFVLLECRTNGAGSHNGQDHNIQVTLLPAPPNTTVAFAQPASRKALSMNEAEQAIQDQRNNMTRYMMHSKQQNSFLNQNAKPVSQSKARLMGRLVNKATTTADGQQDETDDIMNDVAFRDRKGNTKARKDLLNSLGDEGVKVDDDGVLGGANDEEFGGKRRFGAFKAGQDEKNKQQQQGTDKEQGNAGMAMEDGFFQRDVKAEYDELDYDVEEQFDDDDVDVGETMVVVEDGVVQEEDDEEDTEEDNEGGNEVVSGAEGLASVAGFKAMLAKAKSGEKTDPKAEEEAANAAETGKKDDSKENITKKLVKKPTKFELAQSRGLDSLFKKPEPKKVAETVTKAETKIVQEQKDNEEEPLSQIGPDGLRIVTLKAVRKEIWLNHGQIPMKRLMKLFDVKKKSDKERQQKFREVVKELCTMRTDPVGGRMLVLKQHYSNMG